MKNLDRINNIFVFSIPEILLILSKNKELDAY